MAQIGTIGLETQNSGTVKIPVFSEGGSGSNVYEMLRVQTASGVGFIPVIEDEGNADFPYLRIQTQNHGVCAVHNKAQLKSSVLSFEESQLTNWDGRLPGTNQYGTMELVNDSTVAPDGDYYYSIREIHMENAFNIKYIVNSAYEYGPSNVPIYSRIKFPNPTPNDSVLGIIIGSSSTSGLYTLENNDQFGVLVGAGENEGLTARYPNGGASDNSWTPNEGTWYTIKITTWEPTNDTIEWEVWDENLNTKYDSHILNQGIPTKGYVGHGWHYTDDNGTSTLGGDFDYIQLTL